MELGHCEHWDHEEESNPTATNRIGDEWYCDLHLAEMARCPDCGKVPPTFEQPGSSPGRPPSAEVECRGCGCPTLPLPAICLYCGDETPEPGHGGELAESAGAS